MFDLAAEIESDIGDLIDKLKEVRGAVEALTDQRPDYLYEL